MSRFAADYAAVVRPSLNDVFGETVVYTRTADGVGRIVDVRVVRSPVVKADDELDDRKSVRDVHIAIETSVIAEPVYGDKITLKSVNYKVETVNLDTDKGESYVTAVAITDVEHAEPGTRQNARV